MRKMLSALLLLPVACTGTSTHSPRSNAAPATRPSAATQPLPVPAVLMNLWPGTPPGGPAAATQPEKWTGPSLTNVSVPTLAVYPPPKNIDTHAAVLVCPGGGFSLLSMYHEGADVCRWLNTLGITGVLVKYRVPTPEGMPRTLAGFQDAQRAMCLVRAHAAEWNLDPHRIAMLGFSAGGQMLADVETQFDTRSYPKVDAADDLSARPDLAIAIYPGGIYNRNAASPGLTPDVRPTKDTPPTFIAIATDDRNGSENGVYFYLALKNAGVNAELHVYAEGGHGFGIRPGSAPHTTWPARVEDWLRLKKFIPAAGK
jgi:acetyl esterase/lipase